MNIIEQLNISDAPPRKKTKDLPAVPIEAQLVSMWTRDDPDTSEPETISVRVKYVTESGKEIISGTNSIDLTKSVRVRHVLRFNALPVSGSGLHKFIVQSQITGDKKNSRWATQAQVPLAVVFNESETLSA